jgi:hypothetical protein
LEELEEDWIKEGAEEDFWAEEWGSSGRLEIMFHQE